MENWSIPVWGGKRRNGLSNSREATKKHGPCWSVLLMQIDCAANRHYFLGASTVETDGVLLIAGGFAVLISDCFTPVLVFPVG